MSIDKKDKPDKHVWDVIMTKEEAENLNLAEVENVLNMILNAHLNESKNKKALGGI